jgi:hypothetical protein
MIELAEERAGHRAVGWTDSSIRGEARLPGDRESLHLTVAELKGVPW